MAATWQENPEGSLPPASVSGSRRRAHKRSVMRRHKRSPVSNGSLPFKHQSAGVKPKGHTATKGRERPICRVRGKRVLDRVEMHIVHVACVVPVIPDRVLPEPPLPDAALAPPHPHPRSLFIRRNGFREGFLQRPPSSGVVMVAGWKGPDTMHVVGQHDPSINVERRTGPNVTGRVAKGIDVGDEQSALAVQQVGGEEVCSSRHSVAAVIRHGISLLRIRNNRKGVG